MLTELGRVNEYILGNASRLGEPAVGCHAHCSLSFSLKILLFYFAIISSHRLHLCSTL